MKDTSKHYEVALVVMDRKVTELMEKTLREICKERNISRRTIQGYEQAGLVSPSGRTNRGYLLYGEEEQKRIQTIRFYQELGFSIKEIRQFFDAPNEIRKERIGMKLVELDKKKAKIEMLIIQGHEIMELL